MLAVPNRICTLPNAYSAYKVRSSKCLIFSACGPMCTTCLYVFIFVYINPQCLSLLCPNSSCAHFLGNPWMENPRGKEKKSVLALLEVHGPALPLLCLCFATCNDGHKCITCHASLISNSFHNLVAGCWFLPLLCFATAAPGFATAAPARPSSMNGVGF